MCLIRCFFVLVVPNLFLTTFSITLLQSYHWFICLWNWMHNKTRIESAWVKQTWTHLNRKGALSKHELRALFKYAHSVQIFEMLAAPPKGKKIWIIAKLTFITFSRLNLTYDSNFPAHRWSCKHLKYLDRLGVKRALKLPWRKKGGTIW